MDLFPYSQLSRGYTRGWPRWQVIDSGVASMRLGNGILRTRDELGQALYAIDLRLDAVTQADAEILWTFIRNHRATTFWWEDPLWGPLSTRQHEIWECRFDPAAFPLITVREDARSYRHAAIRLLPVVPTMAVS